MSQQIARVVTAAVLISLGLLALSGCTPRDSISARINGSDIEFAVCEQFTFDRIEVVAAVKGERPAVLETKWTLEGSMATGGLLLLDYGVSPSGLKTTMGPEALLPVNQDIQIYLEKLSDSGAVSSQIFAQFDGDALVQGSWLNSAGRISDGPCS